jgi:drug/metabolite transporter (DMT)-like permease
MQLLFYLLLLSTSMLWAGNFVAGKFVVGHASVMTLTDLRWFIAVLILLPIVWLKEKKLLPPKKAWKALFFMGATGVVLFNLFMFMALERTTADNVGLISALNPITIAIASFFILREKMSSRQLIGMMISLIGVIVVLSRGEWQSLIRIDFNSGDLYMLAAVAIWGLYSVSGKQAMKYVSPYMATLWAGIFGVGMLIPFNAANFRITNADVTFWIAALYISAGATVLAMLFWNIGVQKVGGTHTGIFLNFNPIFTAILAYYFIGETLSPAQYVGTIIVIFGVFLFTFKKKAVAKAEPLTMKLTTGEKVHDSDG